MKGHEATTLELKKRATGGLCASADRHTANSLADKP